MTVDIPSTVMDQFWALIVVLITAAIAYIQNLKARAATEKAEVAEQKKNDVITYFDPTTDEVPVAPPDVPTRTFVMSDETKRFVLMGEAETDKPSILQQIANAEGQRLATYRITTSRGWYDIEYGLIKASAGGK